MLKSPFILILILTALLSLKADGKPLFTFAVFSDNHGDGLEKIEFKRMYEWIRDNDVKFVIGMGDHIRKNAANSFIGLLEKDEWWRKNFYPVIADNENQFYGKSQADWGAGKEFFGLTDIKERENVELCENGAEYYAVITEKNINIHFISLHYPDQPSDDDIAFKESSRQYLARTLDGIEKNGNDIIVAGAHSRLGYWLNLLNEEQSATVNEKLDLALSATTHVFHIYSEAGSDGPLAVNTGSITRPRLWSPHGFVAVDVFSDPLRFEVNYINCSKEKPERPKLFFRASKTVGKRISAQ